MSLWESQLTWDNVFLGLLAWSLPMVDTLRQSQFQEPQVESFRQVLKKSWHQVFLTSDVRSLPCERFLGSLGQEFNDLSVIGKLSEDILACSISTSVE